MKKLSLPKTGGSSEPLQKGSQTLNVANDFSGPLVSETETDHFGHLKEKSKNPVPPLIQNLHRRATS